MFLGFEYPAENGREESFFVLFDGAKVGCFEKVSQTNYEMVLDNS